MPAARVIDAGRAKRKSDYPLSNIGMIVAIAGACSLASLVLGYFSGRAHLRSQMRSSFEDAGKKLAKDLQEGLGKAFAQELVIAPEKEQEPVAKLTLGQPHNTPEASFTLTSARIEIPTLKGGIGKTALKHDNECLVIGLKIRNNDARRQLRLSYGQPFGSKVFTMHDDVGNDVDTMFFSSPGSDFSIVGSHPAYKDVDPEQAVEHFVAFDMPLPKTKSLTLLIDGSLIGQEGIVQYDIPIANVEGFTGR